MQSQRKPLSSPVNTLTWLKGLLAGTFVMKDGLIVEDLQPECNDEDDSQHDVYEEEYVVALSSEDVDRGCDHQRHREDSLGMSVRVCLMALSNNLRSRRSTSTPPPNWRRKVLHPHDTYRPNSSQSG